MRHKQVEQSFADVVDVTTPAIGAASGDDDAYGASAAG
jgi:hypothetical protein